MTQVQTAPYGTWKSPITSDLIVKESIASARSKWMATTFIGSEMRPSESGRQVIVRRANDGRIADVTPPGFNARTRVHEYGGGEYAAMIRSSTFPTLPISNSTGRRRTPNRN